MGTRLLLKQAAAVSRVRCEYCGRTVNAFIFDRPRTTVLTSRGWSYSFACPHCQYAIEEALALQPFDAEAAREAALTRKENGDE